jgi:F-type H+-transporting ATPase subunit b
VEIISDFGINPILLLAQIVNFLILLFILNRILFKPLLKVLDERKQKIAQSLKEAEQISAELAQAEKKSREIISSANLKAEELVSTAKEAASQIRLEAQNQAKEEAEKILKKSKETVELEREKMRSSLRRELMEVVVLATEKILGKSLSKEEKEVITKNSLKELS